MHNMNLFVLNTAAWVQTWMRPDRAAFLHAKPLNCDVHFETDCNRCRRWGSQRRNVWNRTDGTVARHWSVIIHQAPGGKSVDAESLVSLVQVLHCVR